jgi:hypothetical protein
LFTYQSGVTMLLHKKISSSFEKKNYEIRILYDDSTINVVAFLNNYPVNGFRHQIKVPRQCDVKEFLEKEPVQELVELSRKDITEKRWERLLR